MESLGFKLSTPKQNQTFAEPDLRKRPGKTAENKTEICLPHSSLSTMKGIPMEEQSGALLPLDAQTQLFLVFFMRNQQPHKNTCCPRMHLDSLERVKDRAIFPQAANSLVKMTYKLW